jgi:curli biogenesis system outer membrane secretion channel CsgG
VQIEENNTITREQKKRSQSDKIGRLKYNQQLLKQVLLRQEHMEQMLRTIFRGLEGMFNFQKPFVQKIACKDEVDAEILELLYQSQPDGLFPKDVAARLTTYKINRFQVTRRLKAMNRRLVRELGQNAAEKRGHHWALAGFTVNVWGEVTEGE